MLSYIAFTCIIMRSKYTYLLVTNSLPYETVDDVLKPCSCK